MDSNNHFFFKPLSHCCEVVTRESALEVASTSFPCWDLERGTTAKREKASEAGMKEGRRWGTRISQAWPCTHTTRGSHHSADWLGKAGLGSEILYFLVSSWAMLRLLAWGPQIKWCSFIPQTLSQIGLTRNCLLGSWALLDKLLDLSGPWISYLCNSDDSACRAGLPGGLNCVMHVRGWY